jgi:hypothetical protein
MDTIQVDKDQYFKLVDENKRLAEASFDGARIAAGLKAERDAALAEVKRLKARQLEALDDCLCALGTVAGDYYDGYREAVGDMRRALLNPNPPEVDHE